MKPTQTSPSSDRSLRQATEAQPPREQLVAICMFCGCRRTDDGCWRAITEAERQQPMVFTHGICPGCLQLHYGFVES